MPTIRRCCIVGCASNSRQSPNLQFFQFPRPDSPFYKAWKHACHASLSRIVPFKKPVVCAYHFHTNCIGGRRLTGNAIPTLRLEVPTNLKALEQQVMVEEIDRSRKCAYINAVVYEWLVRANLNPQLRGTITHGMIKEKADTAKTIIGCETFMSDNRWLNRFRETHLTGFAQKLSSNQLMPLGPSLWIPDIVHDLQHLFPPTSVEGVASLENMPEEYADYMREFGDGDKEDDDESSRNTTYQSQQSDYEAGYQKQDDSYDNYSTTSRHAERQRHSSDSPYPAPHYSGGAGKRSRLKAELDVDEEENTNTIVNGSGSHHTEQQQYDDDDDDFDDGEDNVESDPNNENSRHSSNCSRLTEKNNNNNTSKKKLSSDHNGNSKSKTNGNISTTPPPTQPTTTSPRTAMPAIEEEAMSIRSSPVSRVSTPVQQAAANEPMCEEKELHTYEEALHHLRALEDFALVKENFRAIGLISQLEIVLRKGDYVLPEMLPVELDDE